MVTINLLNVQLTCNKNTQGAYGAKKFIDFICFQKYTFSTHYIDNAKNASHKNLKIQTKN